MQGAVLRVQDLTAWSPWIPGGFNRSGNTVLKLLPTILLLGRCTPTWPASTLRRLQPAAAGATRFPQSKARASTVQPARKDGRSERCSSLCDTERATTASATSSDSLSMDTHRPCRTATLLRPRRPTTPAAEDSSMPPPPGTGARPMPLQGSGTRAARICRTSRGDTTGTTAWGTGTAKGRTRHTACYTATTRPRTGTPRSGASRSASRHDFLVVKYLSSIPQHDILASAALQSLQLHIYVLIPTIYPQTRHTRLFPLHLFTDHHTRSKPGSLATTSTSRKRNSRPGAVQPGQGPETGSQDRPFTDSGGGAIFFPLYVFG